MSQDIKLYDKNDEIADKGYHAKPYKRYNYMGYRIINMYEGVYIFINIITLSYLMIRGQT